jgi:hypothetical protein
MTIPRKVKKAYELGKKALLENQPAKCPSDIEKNPEEKKAWYDGYYETYIVNKHQHTFQKYGIKFP